MGAIGPAIIYALELQGIPVRDDKEWLFSLSQRRSTVRYRPPVLSERISVQKAIFSLHPNPTSEWDWGKDLEKFEISPGECGVIKKTLDNLGIYVASVFPGLDGLSEHIEWLYKWGG